MKEKHLLRTDKVILLTHVIVTIFIAVGLISQLQLSGMAPILSIVPLAAAIIALLGSLVMFIMTKGTLTYSRYVAIAYSVVYVLMMLLGGSSTVFPYMIPILVLLIFTLDKKAVFSASAIFFIMNIVRVILTIQAGEDMQSVIETVMVEMIITILVAFGTIKGVQLIIQFFKESTGEIMAVSENNSNISKKIVEVARNIERDTAEANQTLNSISDMTLGMNDSIMHISEEMRLVTDAVNEQGQQTQSIHEIIDRTHEKTSNIVGIADETKSSLNSGSSAMNKLSSHVQTAIKAGDHMKKASSQLQQKSEEVKNITSVIFSISSQTNLLALNASIEAARAGEAGKGFAVVADEIRNLADQTKQSTENISRILDELMSDAQEVADKVEGNVELSQQQSVLADEANSRFSEIEEKITNLSHEILQVSDMMESLLQSNDAIIGSVSTLSASCDQISVNTENICNVSESNVSTVKDFTKIMNSIVEQIEELKKYTAE